MLLADDDSAIRARCCEVLEQSGYTVDAVGDGDAAIERLQHLGDELALAVLDWQMPGLHGESLLQAVSWRFPKLPVVVITGYSSEARAIAAVSCAAGFLRKPFTPQELTDVVKRVCARQALTRKGRQKASAAKRILRAGDLALHLDRLELQVLDRPPVALSPPEFALLRCLLQCPGEVVSRKQAAAAICSGHYTMMEANRVLKHPLSSLRKKLEPDPTHPRYLRSLWRRGLLLDPGGP